MGEVDMEKQFLLDLCIDGVIEYLKKTCENQEEFDNIVEKYFTEDFLIEQYKELIKTIPEKVFESFISVCAERYREEQKENDGYKRHLEDIWGKGFELSNALYAMILEELENYSKRLEIEHSEEIIDNAYKCKVLQLLANRSLQTFASILCLIQNGFGDQAFMLFRSMFENNVFSKFISCSNEQTAKTFFEAQNNDIESGNDYGWARESGLFGEKERINFRGLFEKCKFEKEYAEVWYRQYKLACKLLHTTPQGITKTLCFNSINGQMFSMVGQSPFGLNLAAEHSAIMLQETVKSYLLLFPDQRTQIFMLVVHKWVNEISMAYSKINNEMERR